MLTGICGMEKNSSEPRSISPFKIRSSVAYPHLFTNNVFIPGTYVKRPKLSLIEHF